MHCACILPCSRSPTASARSCSPIDDDQRLGAGAGLERLPGPSQAHNQQVFSSSLYVNAREQITHHVHTSILVARNRNESSPDNLHPLLLMTLPCGTKHSCFASLAPQPSPSPPHVFPLSASLALSSASGTEHRACMRSAPQHLLLSLLNPSRQNNCACTPSLSCTTP